MYTIVKSDGTTLTTIANGTINTSSTSIALPGKNYAGYGEYLDTDLVHMLENFADNAVPANPIRGQLWYNTATATMYICPTNGETNAANWYAITTASSAGNVSLGNLTVTGNILTNNLTATNNIDANSISCNYLTVNVNANMANATISNANITSLRTTSITTGSQSTGGNLTGVWIANGSGVANGVNGTSFYVTGGNLVIANTSSRGIVADYFYYSNGTPITFGGGNGTYSNSNVAAYLPVYGGVISTVSVNAGSSLTAGNFVGVWAPAAGSTLTANTVSTAAQPNITSVGALTSLNVTGNINSTAGNINANAGNIVAGSGYFFKGDGGLLSNISVGAGTSIVNGNSNVSVGANSNVTVGVTGTPNVLVVSSTGINVTGTLNTGAGNANVGNIGATTGVFTTINGVLANGTSNVSIPAVNGNVNISSAGNANIVVVTGTGVNVAGTLNTGAGNANVGNIGATTGVFTTINGTLTNGTSNINIVNNANINLVRGGTARLVVSASGVVVTGSLDVSGVSNLGPVGNVTITGGTNGQVLTTNGSGVLSWSTAAGGTPNAIVNGNSNVTIAAAGGPANAYIGGNATPKFQITSSGASVNDILTVSSAANIPVIQQGTSNMTILNGGAISLTANGTVRIVASTTGANITGIANISGQIVSGVAPGTAPFVVTSTTQVANLNVATAGTATTAGTVTTAAQPNITSVGTLANLTVTNFINCTSGDIVAYSSSDMRLKDNIVVIENALDKIKKISGVMFDWKEGHEIDRKHDTGLIAQEVEAVLPEVVVTRDSGYKAIRYEKVMGLVVQAIKELADQVEELKKR